MRSVINSLTNYASFSQLNDVVVTVRDEVRALSAAHLFMKRDARAMAKRATALKQRGVAMALAGALERLGLITPPALVVCPVWHTTPLAPSHPSV